MKDLLILRSITPLIKDKIAWDAFMALLEHEESKCADKLSGKQNSEELIRINAEFMLIQKLKKARDNWISMEGMMKHGDQ